MKIILVAPFSLMSLIYNSYVTSLGLLSLATILHEHTYDVEIVDFSSLLFHGQLKYDGDLRKFHNDMVQHILAKKPDVVGFNTICNCFHDMLLMAGDLKTNDNRIKIILGGPQAANFPEKILERFNSVDLICLGEAENTILEVVKGLGNGRFTDIPGIVYRENSQVKRNPDAELIDNLDKLPILNYDLVQWVPGSRISMEISRGCPFQCIYCSTSRYWKQKYRVKSIERIRSEVQEAKKFVPDGKKTVISFIDDNFTTNRQFTLDLCEVLQSLDVVWDCGARIDTLDDELLKQMAQAGCKSIFVGLESGSPRIQRFIKKNLDLGRVNYIVDVMLKQGIRPIASFMYGFPGETEEDLAMTLSLLGSLLRKGVTCGIHALCVLGGTQLYNDHSNKLVLRDYCSNITDNFHFEKFRDMLENNRDLFSHLHTLEGSFADKNPFLEEFINDIIAKLAVVFPDAITPLLTIFEDDVLKFYKDFTATVSCFPFVMQDSEYIKLLGDKTELANRFLHCLNTYIDAKAATDFRFRMIKYHFHINK